MSSAEFQLDLSPQAQRDLIDILRYTGKKWGLDQLLAYRDKLNEALRLLKQNPEIGQESDYLPATHRLYLVGSHIIVYRRHGTMIGVVRILHQRMNWIKHLPAL
jgi:toxin ParE1/3/4